ncbi:MAG TPA: response regulator [Chitinophagaceae bacterium]
MKTENKPLRLLIVEDNPGDFILLKKHLQLTNIGVETYHWAERLEDVSSVLNGQAIDMAFLDLTLSDSTGIRSFTTLNNLLPQTPIIVLSGLADMEVARETISLGAQDYLMKGEFDEKILAKSIHYALERKKILEKLQESNERFEIVNKATLDIIWDWDFSTNTISLSSSIQKILGLDQHITIDWFFNHICPDDVEKVRDSLSFTIGNGKKHWATEFGFLLPDGNIKFIYSRGYTLVNKTGKAYRMIGAAMDLTEKRKLENELVNQKINQQKLITETTIKAEEKQKNELAIELHDNINQVLASVKMFLNIAKEDESVREDLVNRSYNHVTYAIEEIRKLSKSLVAPSLGDVGLKEALEELIDEINITKGLKVNLHFKSDQKKLGAEIDLMLYRIAQEQLNNILKYAKATCVSIDLNKDEKNIFVSVTDNGVGFDLRQKAKGIGLKNIKSRVEFYSGTVNIITAPGNGCKLEINIPL